MTPEGKNLKYRVRVYTAQKSHSPNITEWYRGCAQPLYAADYCRPQYKSWCP